MIVTSRRDTNEWLTMFDDLLRGCLGGEGRNGRR
jgi:hypothetical protein